MSQCQNLYVCCGISRNSVMNHHGNDFVVEFIASAKSDSMQVLPSTSKLHVSSKDNARNVCLYDLCTISSAVNIRIGLSD